MKRWQVVAVALCCVALLVTAAVAVWSLFQGQETASRLTRIERVPTPCLADARSAECAKDARHIIIGCLHDPRCLALTLMFGSAERRGVVAQSGSPPGQQPGGGQPPTPAPSPSPSPSPGPSPNPQPNPSPSPNPGPVKRITQTVCHLTPLGVRVCVQVPVG